MKKKLTLLLITMLMVLLVLTACGSSENTEQPKNDVTNENQQEEIPAIGESQEDEEEVVATSTPTPTPAQETVKVERLLLGLGENMRELGTAELDMSMVFAENLSEEDIELMKEDEMFKDIEVTNEYIIRIKGDMACSKDSGVGDFDIDYDVYGYQMHEDYTNYFQRTDSGELIDYYYNVRDGVWYEYNEGETNVPDLTDMTDMLGVVDVAPLATKTVYKEVTMVEDGDKYLVDGKIDFARFTKMTMFVNMFNQNVLNMMTDDLDIHVHMEFGKEDKALRVLSIYLADPKPLTPDDIAQFTELYLDVKYNVTADGQNVSVPMEVRENAIKEN